jgi:hypothetical protein
VITLNSSENLLNIPESLSNLNSSPVLPLHTEPFISQKPLLPRPNIFKFPSAPFTGARVLTVINGWHCVHLCLHLRSSLAFTRRNATNQTIFPSQVYMKFKSLNASKLAQLPILPPSFGNIVNHIHDTLYTLQAQYTPLPLSHWLGHALAGA